MKFSTIPSDIGLSPTLDVRLGGGTVESLPEIAVDESSQAVPSHPYGIKPLGNQYTASIISKDFIGPDFAKFPDEVLAIFLEYLEAAELIALGSSCKFLYAFCRSEDLWKTLFIESPQSKSGSFSWRGTWRSTFLKLSGDKVSQVHCDNVFSDVLYRPFLCTHTPITPYASSIPSRNAITRLVNLSAEEFSKTWSDKPFILTAPIREWPVFHTWDTDALIQKFGKVLFRAEAVDWSLSTYAEYMKSSADESPLYLFDRSFVEKMHLTIGKTQESPSYWAPDCFGEDLFAVLGDERPDDKWLIVGPARSGSTYHKDPNGTSAWNAVLRGSKYWIMFPSTASSPPPPGVYMSEDQSEVTSPLSIAEWLLGFHAEARKTAGCIEGVCREGEVLHVPSGWWHLVVNLEPSIAITQNFVPRAHLSGVLSFLKDRPDQVSGFRRAVTNPYKTFVERMQTQHPVLLQQAIEEMQQKEQRKKRKWDTAVGRNDGDENSVFTFGFGGDSDEDVA